MLSVVGCRLSVELPHCAVALHLRTKDSRN